MIAGGPATPETPGALPRLLYIGDVPICNTVAGGVFFYRLLREYPADKLVVCAPLAGMGPPLRGVRYIGNDAHWPRLLRTRFSPIYCTWIAWRLLNIPGWLRRLAHDFRPQAIVTVSQTTGWIRARALAQRLGLPLIMFAHDDYAFSAHLPSAARPWVNRLFARAYQASAERLCISDAMEEAYRRRYAKPGGVRYPIRDPQARPPDGPAPQTSEPRKTLTFAYAGSIHGEPNMQQLLDFGAQAARYGHRFIVYSPQYAELTRFSPDCNFLEARPPLDPAGLIQKLRFEADCLLIPCSFEPEQQELMRTAFPSKVADYSAVGLPLLVWAAADASIARFVAGHADSAELVTERNPAALAAAFARLAYPEVRTRLARAILAIGMDMFSPERAWVDFADRLRRVTAGRNAG